MTAALASIGPIGWVAIVVGSWIVLSAGLGRGIGRAIRYADAAQDDDTQPAVYPPPVPPSQPVVDLDDWLDGIPAEVLARAELNRRFYDIVDAETRWFADGAA